MNTINVTRGVATALPKGWKLGTFALRAEPDTPQSVCLDFTSDVTVVEAGPGADGKAGGPPKFSMLAYGGGPMRPHLEPPLPFPVVVDLAGMDLTRQKVPALKDHDPKNLVGHTESIQSDGKALLAAGIVSGSGHSAREVIETSRNGFQWQVSIGAEIRNLELLKAGQAANVNGRTVSGPLFIARAGRLREISFLTIGADAEATAHIAARNAAKGSNMDFEQWLAAMGLTSSTLSDEQRTKLTAKYNAEMAGGSGSGAGSGAAGGSGGNAGTPGGGPLVVTASAGSRDLESVLTPAKQKEDRQKAIVQLTATALQENPGQLQIIEALGRQAIAGDWDTQKYELELLRACRPQAGGMMRQGPDDRLSGNVIEAALCLHGGIDEPEKKFNEQTLEAAQKRWRHGLGLGELLIMFARRNGYDAHSTRDVAPLLRAAFTPPPVMLQGSGISTLSLPNILSTVATRFLKMGFEGVENTWRAIAAIRSVNDFRQVTSFSLTGDFNYIEVAPDGQLKHANVSELGYSNQAKTYGRMFAIDRRDIVNDDLGALTQVPRRLGRGGALKFNLVFWTTFMNNASFFTSGNGTFLAGATPGTNDTRLNIEGLTAAETAFLNQTDPDGNPFAATPRILLTPNALAVPAAQFMAQTQLMTTNVNTTITTQNPHAGKYTPVRSSYLSNAAITGNSTTAWYLLSDPNDIPVIEVAFLNGVETPTVEQADADFNQLGIQMRGYHDWGVALQEYRGGLKMKGAA